MERLTENFTKYVWRTISVFKDCDHMHQQATQINMINLPHLEELLEQCQESNRDKLVSS